MPSDAAMEDVAGDAPSDVVVDNTKADSDASDPGPAFAAVLKIFKARCTQCHAAGAIAPGMPSLHLTSDVAYRSLVGVPAQQTCGGTLVVPSSAAQSYLMRKLIEGSPCEGMQMPMAYEAPFMPLADADLQAIRSWIDQGAAP